MGNPGLIPLFVKRGQGRFPHITSITPSRFLKLEKLNCY
jgi:hypothetical protein